MTTEPQTKLVAADFSRLADVVYRHCGINLNDGKRTLVEARLGKLVRQGGFASPADYLDEVLDRPADPAFVKLIDALSTNLTSFFRENDHFQHLTREFLPELLARKAAVGVRRIRAWSAGCSSGEEPYTLAMVLSEAVPAVDRWDVKILATDISTKVLATAEQGSYDAERTAGIPPQLRAKYFAANRLDGHAFFDAQASLRRMIAFRRLNLMEPWPFAGPFDFIFCRNVMIYFDKPTQAALVNRYHQALAPGGLLFTGHSESLTGVKHPFEFVRATIYRKR